MDLGLGLGGGLYNHNVWIEVSGNLGSSVR